MPYQATIAARLSQFGKTFIDLNLVDSEGVMPPARASVKFNSEKPTGPEMAAARNKAIITYTQLWQQEQQRAANERRFLEVLKEVAERRAEAATAAFKAAADNADLTAAQKQIAQRVVFEWRLG